MPFLRKWTIKAEKELSGGVIEIDKTVGKINRQGIKSNNLKEKGPFSDFPNIDDREENHHKNKGHTCG